MAHAELVFKDGQGNVAIRMGVPDGSTVRHQDGRSTPGDQVQPGDVVRVHDGSFLAVDEVN